MLDSYKGNLVNQQSKYLKVDVYLLNLVPHDFDVKLSHYLFSPYKSLLNIDVFLTLKPYRKQFQSTTHSVNAEKLLRSSTYYRNLFLF